MELTIGLGEAEPLSCYDRRYLNSRILPQENQKRFHFFNSFFFTKLLESSSSTGFEECKVDYEQIRKWSGKVNIFEKDYVFIPIIER